MDQKNLRSDNKIDEFGIIEEEKASMDLNNMHEIHHTLKPLHKIK
jgi:hypothetical protein